LANWLATAIAALALVVSMATAIETYLYRRRQLHGAQVTAYFHWNQELSRVDLPNGETIRVGYNLVLWNQGPATARDVRVEVRTPSGDAVQLAALEANEFPLRRLDAGGRYPIQFARYRQISEAETSAQSCAGSTCCLPGPTATAGTSTSFPCEGDRPVYSQPDRSSGHASPSRRDVHEAMSSGTSGQARLFG
jgi:hypothetical protein